LHALPAVHTSVTTRLFLFTPVIVAINLGVAVACWRRAKRGARASYLPLAVLELVFLVQLSLRAAYLIASESHELTFMGSQFLQTSGSLFVLVFLSVAMMGCALIVTHHQEQALRRASLTDALTGWLNRRALNDTATQAFRRCQDAGLDLHFITFDIDHFKAINDRYGHAMGDAAIRHVSALSASVLRGHDTLFRIGGEEFAVLLTGVRCDDVCAIAERLREGLAATPLEADGHALHMTVSLGVAERSPHDEKWEDVLRRADEALYHAKQNGRNRVGVHGRDLRVLHSEAA
jgi:diguanylate cyclase (GGDEF)-like protein